MGLVCSAKKIVKPRQKKLFSVLFHIAVEISWSWDQLWAHAPFNRSVWKP